MKWEKPLGEELYWGFRPAVHVVYFTSLCYEPTRVLSRHSCLIIYVLLVVWFFLLFGQFCGRNVVGEQTSQGFRSPVDTT